MCHQTVGLVQGELERRGIATVSVTLLPELTRKIRVPRALAVPYPLGFPFGEANRPQVQHAVLAALLRLTRRTDVPLIAPFKP